MSLQTKPFKLESNSSFLDIESVLYEQALIFFSPASTKQSFKDFSDLAEQFFLEGRRHGANENWPDAVKSFQRLVRLAPSAKSYFLLGVAYHLAGDFKKADKYLEKAAKNAPNNHRFQSSLGAILIRQGKLTKALKRIKAAIRLNPNEPTNHFLLGVVQSNLHKWNLAIEAYEEAIRLDDNSAIAFLMLASAYMELGFESEPENDLLFKKAIENLKIYQKFDPKHLLAQITLGNLYYLLGRLEEAEKAFTKALKQDPNNSDALSGLRLVKEDQLAQRLFESGSLKRVNKRIIDFTPYQKRVPIEVKGKPLSETIIEERR